MVMHRVVVEGAGLWLMSWLAAGSIVDVRASLDRRSLARQPVQIGSCGADDLREETV